MTPTTKDAYQLFHRGAQVLARMEENGAPVDVKYVKRTELKLAAEVRELEKELQSDEIWKVWKKAYGDKATLGSHPQLADVIFDKLGYPRKVVVEEDSETKAGTMNESAFRAVKIPFVHKYFRMKKLEKLRSTYFQGILREVCEGKVHPSFDLHKVVTYRLSSSLPNYQNIPAHNPELADLIRRAYVASEGWQLVEVDLSGAEVRVSQCYHGDPNMLTYLLDPTTDMHRDTAADLFLLDKEFIQKNKDWAKHTVRNWAKNRFVFAEFYGSVYFQRAAHIWQVIEELDDDGSPKYKLPCGKPLIDHLKDNGIVGPGECDPKRPPVPGTYEYHCQKVEKSFWQERFAGYSAWKQRWYHNYQAKGYFDTLTGFRCHGLMSRNQVLNTPIQGSAAHVELLACILMQEYIDKHKMRAKLIGTIHDSTVADVPPDEVDDYVHALRHIITRTIPKRWPWIVVPLEVEAEVAPVGGSWAEKKFMKLE